RRDRDLDGVLQVGEFPRHDVSGLGVERFAEGSGRCVVESRGDLAGDRSIESRSTDRVEMPLDVAVQTRCTATDTDRVAELVELTDQIEAYLNRLNLEADAVAALWKGSEIDPLYDAAMLHHDRVFTSVLTLTYAVFVDRREPVGGGA
ncbi:MAG: hypothetical protein AAGG38_13455, partial [Planctomycetota bacterium]